MRQFLAAIVGGVVVFVWGAISHMALPLGHAGFHTIQNEEAVLTAIRAGAAEPGLYFFPGFDVTRKMTTDEEKSWTEKLRRGPSGLLVVQPSGGQPMTPGQLGTEWLSNMAAAVIAAMILGRVGGSFVRRALVVGFLGIFVWLNVEVSYWNWYKFPTAFTLAALVEHLVGWTLAGFAMAGMVRPNAGA